MYFKRAKTELETAEILFQVSKNENIKQNFQIYSDSTYYSGVISHAYYAIFYSAKAMLLARKIETVSPEIHRKTLAAFEKEFIDSGLLDAKLLAIYKKLMVRAETLLEIFKEEKRKRGDFTYNTIPQANMRPAEESIKNAKDFIKHCNAYLTNS